MGDVFVSLGDSDPRSCVCTGVCSVSLAEVPLRLLFLVVASCWCGFAYARGCRHLPTVTLLELGSPGFQVAGIVFSSMYSENLKSQIFRCIGGGKRGGGGGC